MSSVFNPEDIPKFDIKEVPSETEITSRSPKKKFTLLTLTLLLFLTGFLMAPSAVDAGQYQITLTYGEDSSIFPIILNNSISTSVDLVSVYDGQIEIRYYLQYPSQPGTVLNFEIRSNLSLSDIDRTKIWGKISNNEFSHTFIGEPSGENSIIYKFKVMTDTRIAMGLLLAISFLWLTELIPLAATSLIIPVVLVIMEVQTATKALSYFAEPIIFLFLAGFLMAEAMKRTKLDQFISYRLFSVIPPNGKFLLFTMMTLSAVFSMFMSNTAAVAILIPLALQLLKGVDVGDARYRKTMVLGIAYAATVGGIGSQIGTPPNIIAVELLKEFDPKYEISFIQWFMFGIPVVFIMLPVIFGYLWIRFRPEISIESLRMAQTQTKLKIHDDLQLTKEQLMVMMIFSLTLGLWLTSTIHGISTGIVALLAAVLLFLVGQLEESDLNVINWNALLTFGGGLSLGGLIIQTGLAEYIGNQAIFIADFPLILVLFVIALVGLVLTAFASNTASAVIMIPIVVPLAYVLGISPVVLGVLVAVAASVDFAIVIGTPPTMMAYSTGLFKVQEIFRIGIVLDIIGLFVITLLSWGLFGVLAGMI